MTKRDLLTYLIVVLGMCAFYFFVVYGGLDK